jgi:hypothetical protein
MLHQRLRTLHVARGVGEVVVYEQAILVVLVVYVAVEQSK